MTTMSKVPVKMNQNRKSEHRAQIAKITIYTESLVKQKVGGFKNYDLCE